MKRWQKVAIVSVIVLAIWVWLNNHLPFAQWVSIPIFGFTMLAFYAIADIMRSILRMPTSTSSTKQLERDIERANHYYKSKQIIL